MHVLEQTKKKSHHILVLIRASRDEFRNNLKNLILQFCSQLQRQNILLRRTFSLKILELNVKLHTFFLEKIKNFQKNI